MPPQEDEDAALLLAKTRHNLGFRYADWARLQIRERYPEPRVWAAFIGVGEASGIGW